MNLHRACCCDETLPPPLACENCSGPSGTPRAFNITLGGFTPCFASTFQLNGTYGCLRAHSAAGVCYYCAGRVATYPGSCLFSPGTPRGVWAVFSFGANLIPTFSLPIYHPNVTNPCGGEPPACEFSGTGAFVWTAPAPILDLCQSPTPHTFQYFPVTTCPASNYNTTNATVSITAVHT